jgi:hypothetical protein
MPGIPTELLKGYPDMGVLLAISALPTSGKILPIHLQFQMHFRIIIGNADAMTQ